jgi:ankyrin repeat protein
MPWSQEVVISILFPYLLPSLPVSKEECWSKRDVRPIFERLLMSFCNILINKTRKLLETFTRRMLSIPRYCRRNHNKDLYFLMDIENRCSFIRFNGWKSSVYTLYTCSFLIQYKIDVHQHDDFALRFASEKGYKDTVSLLLEQKANVHARDDEALRNASVNGQKDVVSLLLEHKANVHADNNSALRLASYHAHKDIVSLLLEHKADVHVNNDLDLQEAIGRLQKDVLALLF